MGLFHNSFELPADLPGGDYYLRAYTNSMQNTEPEFHYSRNLKIGNSLIDTKVESKQKQKHKSKPDNPIHAIVTSSDGVTKRFDLPVVENTGLALQIRQRFNILHYEILKPQTTEWSEKVFLLAHT